MTVGFRGPVFEGAGAVGEEVGGFVEAAFGALGYEEGGRGGGVG